ncbi:MAG TPA: MarR family transcriptional regulator [Gemmatimonadota bacterium]|nr:MarR family transcriptional regulator [Gemmatimonadota bacterium]
MDTVVEEFIERMGMEARCEGLARTAARVFAYMVVRGGPCSGDELAETLEISRGGVSMSTRYLESRGLLERTGLPGDQRVYHQMPDDPFGNLVETALERRRRIRDVTREARLALETREEGDEGFEGAAERLARMEAFYDHVVARMETGLETWKETERASSASGEHPTERNAT